MSGDVLIVAAVAGELAKLRAGLNRSRIHTVGGRRVETGRLAGAKVRLLVAGVGAFNTVQALTAAIESRRPGLLIMTGTAGAFAQAGLGVGDIAVAQEEVDVHLGIESPEHPHIPSELPFAIAQKAGRDIRHRCPLDPELAARCRDLIRRWAAGPQCAVTTGTFVTVATVTASAARAEALYKAFRPQMESMEGIAGALTAAHYNLPFVEVRAASNRVGERSRDRWDLPLAAERACAAVRTLLAQLPGLTRTADPQAG
jgi:futalosine hydrolase